MNPKPTLAEKVGFALWTPIALLLGFFYVLLHWREVWHCRKQTHSWVAALTSFWARDITKGVVKEMEKGEIKEARKMKSSSNYMILVGAVVASYAAGQLSVLSWLAHNPLGVAWCFLVAAGVLIAGYWLEYGRRRVSK